MTPQRLVSTLFLRLDFQEGHSYVAVDVGPEPCSRLKLWAGFPIPEDPGKHVLTDSLASVLCRMMFI
jgi:hypothetical protein